MNKPLRAQAEAATTPQAGPHGGQAAPAPQDGTRPVFLVGMMGAGKTTLGRALAKELGREFADLDLALEARCGVPVAAIFDIEGEAGFRKRETQLLDEFSRRGGLVLATGGGAVMAAENRRVLKERGTVVYLRAEAGELYRRLARDKQRPLLQTADPRARLTELLALRTPLYEEVAHISFDSGALPVAQAAARLAAQLQAHEKTRENAQEDKT
jgi:shikimate kinase